jgi:hypothetical protein
MTKFTRDQIKAMSPDEYAKNRVDIFEAMLKGEIGPKEPVNPLFTRDQIKQMRPDEYEMNRGRIFEALSKGQVI